MAGGGTGNLTSERKGSSGKKHLNDFSINVQGVIK